MMRARLIGCVLLAIVAVGCSAQHASQIAKSDPSTSKPAAATPTGVHAEASFSAVGHPVATPTSSKSPSQPSVPFVFPLTGTVNPSCVKPGTSATLTVRTLTQSAVAFDTHYSDGRTGGPPPFGSGLGGNASGLTDDNGNYSSSWVVAPNAPAGKAYVDVIAGHGDKTKEIHVPFNVSNALGVC
jgi:hypothetical protein